MKTEIRSTPGKMLFMHEKEGDTLSQTLEKAIMTGVNLEKADLSLAILKDTDLSIATSQ